MNMQKIEKILTEFIKTEFNVDDSGLSQTSNLFEDGYIDSVNLEAFFVFIENRFHILLSEDMFFDERIATISGIADIILELQGE